MLGDTSIDVKEKGIVLDGFRLKVVTVGEDGYTIDDVLTHDSKEPTTYIHNALAAMKYPDFPVALGVIRDVDEPTYNREVARQVKEVQEKSKIKCMDDLLNSGETWTIE